MNAEEILGQADTCVKCGLCLPHCPTYRKTSDESESPRGRISLIQGILAGPLKIEDARVQGHLSRCLQCRACESACPSEVPFTSIIDEIRARRQNSAPWWRKRIAKILLKLVARPALGMRLHNIYLRSGLRSPLKALGAFRSRRLKTADSLIGKPTTRHPLSGTFQPDGACLGRVALFPGCVGRHLDNTAIEAAVQVLTRLGFETFIPAQSLCCGAIYRHEGFPDDAEREVSRCEQTLDPRQYDAILGFSSACTGELTRSKRIGDKVQDINRFLSDTAWPEALGLVPLPERISVHIPCTQRNLLRDPDAALRVLEKIPELDIQPLADNSVCCGAAGSYLLREPELSQSLRSDKIAHLNENAGRYLVTSNIGCALHLAAGLREQGSSISVRHPIELIVRQLPPKDGKET